MRIFRPASKIFLALALVFPLKFFFLLAPRFRGLRLSPTRKTTRFPFSPSMPPADYCALTAMLWLARIDWGNSHA